MREKRSGLAPDERARAVAAAVANLAALPELRATVERRGCVAGFVATWGELDPGGWLNDARSRGARVVLPRVWPSVDPPRLRFHDAAPSELQVGAFGIGEPPPTNPEVAPEAVDVMVVPGLAFDASGARLGYGGGYYDELLSLPGGRPAFVVGFGHDFQVVDTCPAGDRDARLDCVVTDARVIRCDLPAGMDAGAGAMNPVPKVEAPTIGDGDGDGDGDGGLGRGGEPK